MENNEKNYMFNIIWEDRLKNPHKVGILTRIEKIYYLLMMKEDKVQGAYKMGFRGMPGFKDGRIYKSAELFDFFKNRVIEKGEKACQELAETKGISMVDSFKVEPVSDRIAQKQMDIVIQAYKIQEQKEKRMAKEENEKY